MTQPFVLRNARIIDGTGAPSRSGDVGIVDGSIVMVGDAGAMPTSLPPAEVIDLDGLALTPGFIDVHTHYDAQVFWDPDLTPSSWHGVTSAVMGNCGFGIAPTRMEHRGLIARTLENVEGMSVDALRAGIPWGFETFPEYLRAIEQCRPRLNVGAFIGHTPLRLYVLGDEATERAATSEEIAALHDLVLEAMQAGAIGFSTSRAATHVGAFGKPVPSRLAESTEIFAIGQALKTAGAGMFQVAIGPGFATKECSMLAEQTGRPLTWCTLLTGIEGRSAMESLERASTLPGELWPQIACRPMVIQVQFREPYSFATSAAFKEVLAVDERDRPALYADPAWRARARDDSSGAFGSLWEKMTIAETVRHGALRDGPTIAALAAQCGRHPLDVAVDLALDEQLSTRFRVVLSNDDASEIAELLRDPRTLLGLSDAGAHASQMCDACFSTHLLEHWVRETKSLSLEQAVWRLTGQPAQVLGLRRRGRLAPGLVADLVAFDPDTIGITEFERVWDLPAGADRLIAGSRGIEDVWVNGTAIRRGGRDLSDVRPGQLLRCERG